MKRERTRSIYVYALATAVLLAVAGCGGGGGTTAPIVSDDSALTGVRTDGAWSSQLAYTALSPSPGSALNPNYHDTYLRPAQMSVALAKFELLKSVDDESPYVVFTASVGSPREIQLTGGTSATFGENTAYPPAGTYTHARMVLVYIQTRFTLDDGLGNGLTTGDFRLYASSVGNIRNGDVVRVQNSQMYWMTSSYYQGDDAPFQNSTSVGPRPDSLSGTALIEASPRLMSCVVQDYFFSEPDHISPDPYEQVIVLPTPIVVPGNPSGQYRVVVDFDVTSSPQDPVATGLFLFDDVNNNGIFEPGPGEGDGSDRDFNDGIHGEPHFCILAPTMSVSYTKMGQ